MEPFLESLGRMDPHQLADVIAELLNASNTNPARANTEPERERICWAQVKAAGAYKLLTGQEFKYDDSNEE